MAEVDSMTGKDASGTAREFPTLKPLIERVGALTAPAAGSVNAQLAALLAKLIAAPATEAKQDAAITSLGAIVTALASLATSAKQDTAAGILALIGTRTYGTAERVTVGASSTLSSAIAATEVMVHSNVRCFIKPGAGTPVAAAVDSIPIEAGEKFHMRITSGHKIAVIQDGVGGFLHIVPVVA